MGAAGVPEPAAVGCGSDLTGLCRRRRSGLDEGQDVLLGDATAAAGAFELAGVDPVLRGDPRDHRGDERVPVAGVAISGRGSRLRLGLGDGCRLRLRLAAPARRLRGLCLGRLRFRRRPAQPSRLAPDPREHRPDLDGLAFLDEDLAEDAARVRGDLGVDLVGRDLEQRLVGLDRVADVLQPLRHRSLRDGDAHLGHDDVDDGAGCHLVLRQLSQARDDVFDLRDERCLERG